MIEELTEQLNAARANLTIGIKQRDKTIERLLEDNKALVEKIKAKDKAFSELSWNYSQMLNSDINPPSTELRFIQISTVSAGEQYEHSHFLYGLTKEGEMSIETNKGWEPVSMERTKDS